ncbi:MAG: transcriptional regulator AlsR family [Holophagaceae bacterium]|nr:transcriptional regulator AlsR family [Holophagaceae bacterium]
MLPAPSEGFPRALKLSHDFQAQVGLGLGEALVDARQLRSFMAAAKFLSFSKAAKHLGMTQPTISYQVASLERSLGLKLFVRSTRAVHLTPTGLYFFGQVQRLSAEFEAMVPQCQVPSEGSCEGGSGPGPYLDVRQLQCFLAVASSQSFTRVGQSRCRTRPGISYQVVALEKSLGKSLFQRGHNFISLTEVGRAFAEQVHDLLTDYEHVLLQAKGIEKEEGRGLTIGFLDGVLTQTLPGLIRAFSMACPGVRVKTMHVSLARMLDAILAGEIDCGFAPTFDHVCLDGVQSLVVLRDRMVAVMSEDHPFANREKLRLSHLKGQPLLSLAESVGGLGVKWHRSLCAKWGLDSSLTEYSPDFPSMFMAIGMGQGIAIQPRQILQEYGNVRIRAVALEDDDVEVEFVVAWRAEGSNPLLPTFLQGFNQISG